ncbi:MAG TPA: thioether cross-link-forming SCIFF peptide maturase, partial [Candidatus Limnocylindria bacterium]|nr:thioether cross-link-forming SCIFF peptide maturase [Candidatus Limnocylindria bacterium]
MTHTYSLNGYHVALDVFSGSVHLTDEAGLLTIRLYEAGDREETVRRLLEAFPGDPAVTRNSAVELLDELDRLKAAGKLYTPDTYEQHAGTLRQRDGAVKALCLHVAHGCNLACDYCFAGKGDYGTGAALMSEETGRAALDFLVARSGTRRHLEVDFFGGEPLLNWDVVKRLVAYGRELEKRHGKAFRFTLTTNGVLLDDEVTDFCNREMHNVVLSLDGREAVHDRFRRDRAGRGSYARVVPNFQKFVRARGERGYYVRGTYTRHNLDFSRDVLHMADLGFTQLSMEPAVTPPGDPNGLTEEHLPALFVEYERLAAEMLKRRREGRGFDFYHFNV